MQTPVKNTRSVDNLLSTACSIKDPERFLMYRTFLLNGYVVGVTSPQGDLYDLRYSRGLVVISPRAPTVVIPPKEFTINNTTGDPA